MKAQKRQFDREMQTLIEEFKQQGFKPRLLLHLCCAPCSTAVLEQLKESFQITLLFDNPNLDSEAEFARRASEAKRLNNITDWADDIIIVPYQPDLFQSAVMGLEDQPEGGSRCEKCFALRLSRTAERAKTDGYDFFTTTLSVSPHKNSALLNRIGEMAGENAGVSFLPSDFKKRDGFLRSVQLSAEFKLHRQDYCGCVYSKRHTDRDDEIVSLYQESGNHPPNSA